MLQKNGPRTSPTRAYWIGIDPGKSGGIAILNQDLDIKAIKMPATPKDIVDFLRPFSMADYTFAVVEKVSSSPQMGVVSAFTFGRSYGELLMALASLEIRHVEKRPQEWMRHMGCLTKGDKNVSKTKAQQLFPQEKITHAVADAMLIAKFAYEKYRHEPSFIELEG